MSNRNPLSVFFLSFITCGIYGLVWYVKTKEEMNELGAEIPTAWIWLIPFFGSIYWIWKYAEGVDLVTEGRMSSLVAFVLLVFTPVGQPIVQSAFNKIDSSTNDIRIIVDPA
jgi:hypothetical protein